MNYFELENKIVEDIFTEQEIQDIYDHVAHLQQDKGELVEVFSHKAYHGWLPQHIVEKIISKAQSAVDEPIQLEEMSFASYQKYREELPVQLIPHFDETFRERRLTFDIQVRSNRDWPLVVEGREYTLKDNQALIFSGTHQIHWRKKTEFKEGDQVDMIFCHFKPVNVEPNELGPYIQDYPNKSKHDKLMTDKRTEWEKFYNES